MAEATYLQTNVKLLTFIGFYPVQEEASKIIKALHYLFKNACMCILSVFVVQIALDLVQTEEKTFNEIGMKTLNMCIVISAMLNGIYFQLKKGKLQAIINTMNAHFWYGNEGLEVLNMGPVKRRVELMTKIWAVFILFAALVMSFRTIFADVRALSVSAWYPFNWTRSPAYTFVFLHQLAVNTFVTGSFVQTDVFVAATVYTTVNQFKILESNFRNVVFTALLDCGISRTRVEEFSQNFNGGDRGLNEFFMEDDMPIVNIIESKKFQAILAKSVKKNIKQCIMLLKYCETIEDVMSPLLLIKLMFLSFFLVFINLTIVTNNDKAFILALAYYAVAVIATLTLYTKTGDMFHKEMGSIIDSVYDCPWYLCPKDVRKMFLFTIVRCKKPLNLTAGKIMVLSLETLVKILRTSFSFFTMLRQTTERVEHGI